MGKNKRKAELPADGGSKPNKRNTPVKEKKQVKLDNLNWQKVEFSGQLDDYEGFFGLEEVDDVEIVREGDLVTFKSAATGDEVVEANNADETMQNDEDDGDSWNGFSDDDEEMEDVDENSEELDEDDEDNDEGMDAENQPRKQNMKPKSIGNGSFKHLDEVALGEDEELDSADLAEWEAVGISPDMQKALAGLKFTKPTPVQVSSIPLILDGRDVVAKAETGSGKTLAFGIPIIEKFLERSDLVSKGGAKAHDGAWALIISPTRELAHQIGRHLEALCQSGTFEAPRIAIVTGGLSVHKQERVLTTADIVVATPGRIADVMNSAKEDIMHRLRGVKYLVLDEADRLMSGGRIFSEYKEVATLIADISRRDEKDSRPEARQTLLFSATFDRVLQSKLGQNKFQRMGAKKYEDETLDWLKSNFKFYDEQGPQWIDLNRGNQVATGIKEGMVECGSMEKDLYLYAVLMLHLRTRTLVFLNSISAVKRVTPFLQALGLPAQTLHSNMMQKARLRTIEKFTSTESSILIATDVAARGLDIPGVELVVHYHLPRKADMYVHRSGRTARGSNTGASIILCCPEEIGGLKRLISRVHETRGPGSKYSMQVIDIDRKVVARLKPRATIAKKIADVGLAKEKGGSEDQFFREAAEELGVEYDSEELDKPGRGKQARGNARKKKQRQDKTVSKDQMAIWKAELKQLLGQRVNVGVSERYLAQGVVDIDVLLRGETGNFLGAARSIDLGVV